MKRALVILLAIAFTAVCHAGTRWCPILGLGVSDTMRYPPIARAAHISGVVIGRIQFLPSGAVTGFDVVSGPPILLRNVSQQVKAWRIKTSAAGPETCLGLAIFKFVLEAPDGCSIQHSQDPPKISTSSGVLSLSIRTKSAMLCDPSYSISIVRKALFRRLLSLFKR